ncbi:MAG: tetratricopeptide repeat protein [Desulfobacterales bacterium]
MADPDRQAKVFLCHASEDKGRVREIWRKLKADGFSPWLDKEDLLPGQLWMEEIPRVIRSAACMLVFLSTRSVAKRGYIQKEYKLALETLDEIPEGKIFLIPVRIDDCKIPDRFSGIHCCDLFVEDGYERIVKAVRTAMANELPEASAKEATRFLNLPLDRNMFFTGRELIIRQLNDNLKIKGKVALSGIPGVGKTQIALEYAYRYGKNYRAVLWLRAETEETLITSFIAIAGLLDIPEKDDPEEDLIVQAVKDWLVDHDRWLMVFDNADDMTFVRDFYPIAIKGHVLLTTRSQTMGGMAHRILVTPFTPEVGARYLVQRAGIISPDAYPFASQNSYPDAAPQDVLEKIPLDEFAEQLSIELGGLPLAIDQAGAFMEEYAMSPEEFLSLYREEGKQLRQERGKHDAASQGHSASVTITFSLAYKNLIDMNPAGADLLCLCAFLYPEQIPEQVLIDAAEDLGETLGPVARRPMEWIKARQAACRLSLLSREIDSKSLNMHRVVQAVLKDEMSSDIQKLWAERAVRAINQGFPDVNFENWPDCERLISQARTCSALIVNQEFAFPEAGRLLIALADYHHCRGRYKEAEDLYNCAIEVRKKIYGKSHPEVGTCFNNLAALFCRQGRYEEAARLYQNDIDIQEQAFGPDHQHVGTAINNLAEVCRIQGEYEKAETLYRRALDILEKTLGATHPNLADTLNNMGLINWQLARYDDAEQLCQRALKIREVALGAYHPDVADSLTNLAAIYRVQTLFSKAEPLFMRALDLREKTLGPEHPDVANSLKNLGLMYMAQERCPDAERSFERAIDILESTSLLNSQDAEIIFREYAQLLQKSGQTQKLHRLRERIKQKLKPKKKEVTQ